MGLPFRISALDQAAMRAWSTDGSGTGNNVSYWREAICEAIFELDFASSDCAMRARLFQQDLGALKLSDVSISSAHQVVRSRQAAARDKSARFNLNYIREGSWQVDHYGREVAVGAGELVLFDSRQPYTVTAQEGTTHVSAHLPIDWLRCWLPSPEDAVAKPIRAGSPWYATLTSTLDEALQSRPEDISLRSMCAQQIGGALALSLGGFGSGSASQTRGIYRRIMATIQEQFCDHSLDVASVATAVQISPRYLHKILAQAGTTFVVELYAARLEQAQAMLANPMFSTVAVAEIGWRCGFCDPSHFSRKFRVRFGCSPGYFRMAGGVLPH